MLRSVLLSRTGANGLHFSQCSYTVDKLLLHPRDALMDNHGYLLIYIYTQNLTWGFNPQPSCFRATVASNAPPCNDS